MERFREFKELTDDLVLQLESIGDKLETMNGGTASVALILANWKSVVQSISLASLALMKESNDNNKEAFPEPLVRVRVGQSNEENQDEEEEMKKKVLEIVKKLKNPRNDKVYCYMFILKMCTYNDSKFWLVLSLLQPRT